jgi:hypothetical protein
LRKGLILTGFLCLLVLCPSAATVCFANEAAETDTVQKRLGDESDGSLAHPVHLIPLLTEEGDEISLDDNPLLPFSMQQTCGGECHSYDIISTGWHFNAADANVEPGRLGQPWILADARTGTQIPISYRPWPGTFKPEQIGLTNRLFLRIFARHMPGGGVGEHESEDPDEIMREFISGKLEIDCLACHDGDPGHNRGKYAPQVARENFRWAAAATCSFASVSGSARDMPDTYDPMMPEPLNDPKKIPPSIKYRPYSFNDEKQVFFNILRETPADRCYFCHSTLYLTHEHTEKWVVDKDIHLTAGLTCVDCHRNGTDHRIIRGYEGEADISDNLRAATSSCRGCHLPRDDDEAPVAGRLGAPVPEHKGIPTVHFEKLSCTACHSGPWPRDKTILVKTARAHRLGTIGVNKSHEALPHIVAPVFATQADGKIAPHKLIWPSYWGSLRGQAIAPIAFETVTTVIGEVLASLERPVSGDWPALTTEHIMKGLQALAGSVEGKPVYLSSGKLYGLDDSGNLSEEENNPAAQPYLWPIGHNVRPAAQSLGIRYCTDCHATDAPFFFGGVAIDSPIATERDSVKKMVEFQDVDAVYARAFAFSFVFRPFMKLTCLGSCAVLGVVLLLYALRALACVARVWAGRY